MDVSRNVDDSEQEKAQPPQNPSITLKSELLIHKPIINPHSQRLLGK
jgi:hypothetical protein